MPLGILALLCSPVRSLQTLKIIQWYYLVLPFKHLKVEKPRSQDQGLHLWAAHALLVLWMASNQNDPTSFYL